MANSWNVHISVPSADTTSATDPNVSTDAGTANVVFGSLAGQIPVNGASPANVPEGTIGSITAAADANQGANPAITTSSAELSQPATLTFTTDFGSGPQQIQLNLGNYGGTTGVTQYAGSAYSLLGLTQNGVPPGSFSGVTTQANGEIGRAHV